MAKKINIEITNPVGLYATPATELVNELKLFRSHVSLKYNEKSVNMKSVMGVLSLGIPHKALIEITVTGEDEDATSEMIIGKFKTLEIGIVK